jgi:O-antigen ligase
MAAPFAMRQGPVRVTGPIVILIALSWILGKGWESLSNALLKKNAFNLALIAVVALTLIGLINTQNLNAGLGLIELDLTVIVLALFFIWQGSPTQYFYELCKKCFILGVVAASLLIFRQGLQPFTDETIIQNCLFCVIELLVPMHRPYFALYIILAIAFIISLIRSDSSIYTKGGFLLLTLYLGVYLVVMMPKSAIIGLLLGIGLLLSKLMFFSSLPLKRIIFFTAFYLSFIAILIGIFKLRSDYNWQWQESSIERSTVWQASVEVLMQDYNFILGIGTGDESDAIQTQLSPYNPVLAEKHLNAHNEFLSFWMRFGILGLIVMLFIAVLPIAYGWAKANYTLLVWGTAMFFAYMTEDILNREAGVLLISIWIPLLLSRPTYDNVKRNS